MGALGAYHARRNAATLTVLMFHRILPETEAAVRGADPMYTATPQFLSDCVSFLRQHYAIVGLGDVVRSLTRRAPLPPSAVLITFDDGWRDNLEFAAPVLKSVPWTVFVSTGAVQEPGCWWQEALLWALRSGNATEEQLWNLCGGKHDGGDVSHGLLMAFSNLPRRARDTALAPYCAMLDGKSDKPMMLDPDDIAALKKTGVEIGVIKPVLMSNCSPAFTTCVTTLPSGPTYASTTAPVSTCKMPLALRE